MKKIPGGRRRRVWGVEAADGKDTLRVTSRCVVVATGGYGGNKELLKKYCPSYSEDIRSMGLPHQGDGLRMAARIGAATDGLGVIQMEGPIFEGSRNGEGHLPGTDHHLGQREGRAFHRRVHGCQSL